MLNLNGINFPLLQLYQKNLMHKIIPENSVCENTLCYVQQEIGISYSIVSILTSYLKYLIELIILVKLKI